MNQDFFKPNLNDFELEMRDGLSRSIVDHEHACLWVPASAACAVVAYYFRADDLVLWGALLVCAMSFCIGAQQLFRSVRVRKSAESQLDRYVRDRAQEKISAQISIRESRRLLRASPDPAIGMYTLYDTVHEMYESICHEFDSARWLKRASAISLSLCPIGFVMARQRYQVEVDWAIVFVVAVFALFYAAISIAHTAKVMNGKALTHFDVYFSTLRFEKLLADQEIAYHARRVAS